jgi:RNA polymerase sigma-70 factor (ECF subfamily)
MRLRGTAHRSDAPSPDPRGLRELADEDLIRLAERGDENAFEVVYDRHETAAYSLAYRMMGAQAPAQDVVQEAFLSLWRSGAYHDGSRGSVRTWILSVVHHRAIDALRRRTRHDSKILDDEHVQDRIESGDRTDADVIEREQSRAVRAALDALPLEQRRVITLAYFGGFTHSEIARILDAPIGTVKGRMRLGLETMRGQLVGVAEEAS